MVYRRLAADVSGDSFCLHGLNAIWLAKYGGYRVDPRGNREGITTSFDPPREHLAFATSSAGEFLVDEIFPDPLPVVVDALYRCGSMSKMCANLPDWKAEHIKDTASFF